MKPPPENENGGLSAAAIALAPAKEPDALSEAVKVSLVHGDLRLWLREAFNLLELCRTEPEKGLRYLALWFVRLGRAMA